MVIYTGASTRTKPELAFNTLIYRIAVQNSTSFDIIFMSESFVYCTCFPYRMKRGAQSLGRQNSPQNLGSVGQNLGSRAYIPRDKRSMAKYEFFYFRGGEVVFFLFLSWLYVLDIWLRLDELLSWNPTAAEVAIMSLSGKYLGSPVIRKGCYALYLCFWKCCLSSMLLLIRLRLSSMGIRSILA